jgi:hypothetical protein
MLSLQVPIHVKGKDVSVSLGEQWQLHIEAKVGPAETRRVEGQLRKPVKGFGNGSVWELVTEGSCKVHQCSRNPVTAPCACRNNARDLENWFQLLV